MTSCENNALSRFVKEKAAGLGFDLCGIAPFRIMEEHKQRIEEWCSAGMNGDMAWLARDIEKRIDPSRMLPGAKSIIVTGLNYFSGKKQGGNGVPVIAKYAYGRDYHTVIGKRLDLLIDYIKIAEPGAKARSFIDSSSVLEKAWAREAGIGWPGRHSIIINNKIGSFFFIGIIILDVELEYDKPFVSDLCGNCRLCMESCPTSAINENHTIDARKCLAYLTIESKSPIPDHFAGKMGDRVYGCDICQDVCPWNSKAAENTTDEFRLPEALEKMNREEWINLTRERFDSLFSDSPILRRKYDRLMKNVTFVTK